MPETRLKRTGLVFASVLFLAQSRGFAAEDRSPHQASGHSQTHADHDAAPSFSDFNWYYGMLGEKPGVTPDLWWRPKGMPVPFAALLLNSAILYGLLFRLAKKPILDGLKRRKANVLRGMEEAARMKLEAETRLAEYQAKLAHIDEEVARVRRQIREMAEQERQRVLAEAHNRQTRMERDANLLIEQELRGTKQLLLREMVDTAVRSAEVELTARLSPADHERLAEEYLREIRGAAQVVIPVRGRA